MVLTTSLARVANGGGTLIPSESGRFVSTFPIFADGVSAGGFVFAVISVFAGDGCLLPGVVLAVEFFATGGLLSCGTAFVTGGFLAGVTDFLGALKAAILFLLSSSSFLTRKGSL